MARDKELSDFHSRGSINLAYEHIWYDYNDFRDLRVTARVPGTEPLYDFSADVALLYLSLWF